MYSVAPPPEAVSALTVYPGTKVQSQWLRDQTDREACEQRERRHAPNTRCQRKYRYDHQPLQAGAQHQLQQRRSRRHHTAAQRDIRGQSASRHDAGPAHKHGQRSGPARDQEDRRHQRNSGHLVDRCPQRGAAASSNGIQHASPRGWRKRRGWPGSRIVFMNENHPAKPQKYNSPRFCGATAARPGPGRCRRAKTSIRSQNIRLSPAPSGRWRLAFPAADQNGAAGGWKCHLLARPRATGNFARRPESFRGTCDAPSSSTLGDSRFRSSGPKPGLRLCAHRHACDAVRTMQNTARGRSPGDAATQAVAIVHRAGRRCARNAVCTFIFPSSRRVANDFATAGDARRRAHHSPTAKKIPP